MVLVTDPVSPVVTTVPVTLGKVIVLSAVGSVIARVVSNSSAVAPSNTIPPDVATNEPPEIAPVVVIVDEPVSIVPKPDVIDPAFNAPTDVICV